MKYLITRRDFDIAYDFALRYHLDPKKSQLSRTSGASRGLGGVLDSFILGKLVEIGVSNVLKSLNPKKDFELDLDIKKSNEVINEPDIVGVNENGNVRKPNCFLEIKNISKDDRWIGLTSEQFETIKKSSTPEDIYIVGAYIENTNLGNLKQKDLLGVYFKDRFNDESFKDFTIINNIEIIIEYVISGEELMKNGIEYNKGSYLYETEVFELAGKKNDSLVNEGKIKKIGQQSNGILEYYLINKKYTSPTFMGEFILQGKVEIYEKINKKSVKRYIHCISDVEIINKTLGIFNLKKGYNYFFNLSTVGRNPSLNRNNIWVAKRSIPFLQKNKLMLSTDINLLKIAEKI